MSDQTSQRVVKWSPPVSPKQMRVLTDKRLFKLLSGPRLSGKTYAGLHALCLHAWNTQNGSISMVSVTATDSADGGAWTKLHKDILPKWFAGGFGMKYVRRPKLDGATHKLYCEVTNKHGGVTRIQLDSLDNEKEVEHKFKGREFTMMYVSEMSNFKNRFTFDTWQECLNRTDGGPVQEHSFIGDTNPANEGEDSWIWKVWYEFRSEDFSDEKDLEVRQSREILQQQLSLHEFTIDDNEYLSVETKMLQRGRYDHNQDLFDRLYLGRWKKASGDGIFGENFRPNIHVIGKVDVLEPEILLPEETCSVIGTGWDIGSANTAIFFIEPCLVFNPQKKREEYHFKFLDEDVELGRNKSIPEIVESITGKMDFWESQLDTKPRWEHVSDRSAFDRFINVGEQGTYEHKEVFSESNGRIELIKGPVKKRGSVQGRVNLLKKLLSQNRITVSANCTQFIDMLNSIKKGKTNAIDPKSIYKHAFDAATYYICSKCYDEMERDVRNITSPEKPKKSSVVSVDL